jgi:hypothetical protein
MDAFAITGVSRGGQWFLVDGVVGGDDAPAHRYPRVHVMSAAGIADMARSGRALYFAQPSAESPLVRLHPERARRFDPRQVPVEDLPRFAFLEQAGDDDVDALMAVRMGQDPRGLGLRLKRLEALDWVERGEDGSLQLTSIGAELLRHWLATPVHGVHAANHACAARAA